jgi:hypothetical protein
MLVMYSLTVLISLLWFAACSSPEAARTRGVGPGADLGNRGKIVRMHEGARPYEKTPKLIPSEHPPLESANQADEVSRQ